MVTFWLEASVCQVVTNGRSHTTSESSVTVTFREFAVPNGAAAWTVIV